MSKSHTPDNSGTGKKPYGHPENDLVTDYDYTNRPMPGPNTIEDLADQPDPVMVREQNRSSGRQALFYALGSTITLILGAFLLLILSRMLGGPLCEGGEATWICTEFTRIAWPVFTSIYASLALLGCAIIMVRKLNRHLRWWPWMAAFWFLLPLIMLWMTSVLPIAIMDGGGNLLF